MFDLRKQAPVICGMRVSRQNLFYPRQKFMGYLNGLLHKTLHKGGVPSEVIDGLMGEMRFVTQDRTTDRLTRSEKYAERLYQQLKRRRK
jgi:hypothetical protein